MAVDKYWYWDGGPITISGGIGTPGDYWVPTPNTFDPRQGKMINIVGDGGVMWSVILSGGGNLWYASKVNNSNGPAIELYGPHSYEMCVVQFDEYCDQIYMTMLKDD